jgi:hypothetical protein
MHAGAGDDPPAEDGAHRYPRLAGSTALLQEPYLGLRLAVVDRHICRSMRLRLRFFAISKRAGRKVKVVVAHGAAGQTAMTGF